LILTTKPVSHSNSSASQQTLQNRKSNFVHQPFALCSDMRHLYTVVCRRYKKQIVLFFLLKLHVTPLFRLTAHCRVQVTCSLSRVGTRRSNTFSENRWRRCSPA